LGLAKRNPSVTFSSSSLNFLFRISYCLCANHDQFLKNSSFSICKIVSQDFSTSPTICTKLQLCY
jgi:hypothetical protein